jgi:hypothetical protein
MLSLNRISLIGYTGDDANPLPNGPTTISLATTFPGTTRMATARPAQNGINSSSGTPSGNGPQPFLRARRFTSKANS